MAEEGIDYRRRIQSALLGVVRDVLELAAGEGLPGDHYFYLTFDTRHPGVSMPEPVRQQHPEEMTVVLQHQFWDLEVSPESFSVTLRFGGEPARMVVPFAALTGFVDPTAELGLKFGDPEPGDGATSEDDASETATLQGEGSEGTLLPFQRPRS